MMLQNLSIESNEAPVSCTYGTLARPRTRRTSTDLPDLLGPDTAKTLLPVAKYLVTAASNPTSSLLTYVTVGSPPVTKTSSSRKATASYARSGGTGLTEQHG